MLAPLILSAISAIVSIALFTALFAAIYKVLPDTPIAWRDVRTGALLTAVMFTAGKGLIGCIWERQRPALATARQAP